MQLQRPRSFKRSCSTQDVFFWRPPPSLEIFCLISFNLGLLLSFSLKIYSVKVLRLRQWANAFHNQTLQWPEIRLRGLPPLWTAAYFARSWKSARQKSSIKTKALSLSTIGVRVLLFIYWSFLGNIFRL